MDCIKKLHDDIGDIGDIANIATFATSKNPCRTISQQGPQRALLAWGTIHFWLIPIIHIVHFAVMINRGYHQNR